MSEQSWTFERNPYLGPVLREDPAYMRQEPPWCNECHGHRSECFFCGYRGDGLCDDIPYPEDLAAAIGTEQRDG